MLPTRSQSSAASCNASANVHGSFPTVILDASVAVAFVHAEDFFHEVARTWLRREVRLGTPVVLPSILLAELASAIRRATGRQDLALDAVARVRSLRTTILVPTTLDLCEQAADIAASHQIRGCDAIYVALAAQLGETLFTFDREQLERGGAVARVERPA